jgi:tRNA (cmo5U34)-methyltransferase
MGTSDKMQQEFKEWISNLLAGGNDVKVSPEKVKERFDREDPAEYGLQIPKWFPDYLYVHDLICEVLRPFISSEAMILDLGGGTGRIAKLLLDAFPSCRIVIQDFSANMLSEVPNKLVDQNGRFECVEGDFFAETFDLAHSRFDSVVSVHAIHHGRHPADYRRLYHKIYHWLKPVGCFACLDNVAGDTHELATLSYADWAETLRSEYDPESIRWMVETTIREDSPLSLREHLEILHDCGFNRTDVVWKKYIFGLYVGIKSPRQSAPPYK